ncbi:MAG: gamma carbonic anhydrase family protein [Alphaproteobacteria bacterium]|nr:gamma carbonic anhydrase family protein [Alphaproteobacteria bacterium]
MTAPALPVAAGHAINASVGDPPDSDATGIRAVPPIVLPFKGVWPRFGKDVFVAPGAAVIGDVELGDGASVWFGAVVRGDDDSVRIGAGTNVQDGAVIHVFKEQYPTIIGARVTLGHGARLHGCIVEDDAMVGISATVLDGAHVETGAIVAAGAVVSPGKRVGAGELWAGCPARLVRPVKPAERDFIRRNSPHYRGLAAAYLAIGVGKP